MEEKLFTQSIKKRDKGVPLDSVTHPSIVIAVNIMFYRYDMDDMYENM